MGGIGADVGVGVGVKWGIVADVGVRSEGDRGT